MARDPNKPVAIKVDGRGFHFTCSIKGAHLIDASFAGRDFFAYGEDVKTVDIVKLPAYKGATSYTVGIYHSLDYMKKEKYLDTPGWIWEEVEGFDKEKRVAERKARKAQRKAAKQRGENRP